MKKCLKQNKFSLVAILVLVFLGVYCSKGLFTYYAFFTHDGDHHIARSFDAIVALREGHFPLRWTGSLNHYCGIPIYNFFYPISFFTDFRPWQPRIYELSDFTVIAFYDQWFV